MARIDYFYSAHSAYAYLGARALYEICARHDAQLIHRPIALSPVVEAAGGLSFAARSQVHVDYFFGREIERWSEWREVPIISYRPTYHDAPYEVANAVILAAQHSGQDADALSFAVLEAHWRDDADLSDKEVLRALMTKQGMDADALFAAAGDEVIQTLLAANTAQAIELGLFGSPTYIVDGDPFYGQDRLEMVERALTQPFAPTGWSNPPVDS